MVYCRVTCNFLPIAVQLVHCPQINHFPVPPRRVYKNSSSVVMILNSRAVFYRNESLITHSCCLFSFFPHFHGVWFRFYASRQFRSALVYRLTRFRLIWWRMVILLPNSSFCCRCDDRNSWTWPWRGVRGTWPRRQSLSGNHSRKRKAPWHGRRRPQIESAKRRRFY